MSDERLERHARPPRPERLLKEVRFLAEHSDRVVLTHHALQRMAERDIFDVDVLRVLRGGRIAGAILPGDRPGDWKCKLVARIKGAREVGVVSVVLCERKLVVVTVEWEDMR